MPVEAAEEFRANPDHRSVDPASIFYPLASLGLARAEALRPDEAKSRKAYQDFFARWKDADPEIPALKQARRKYEAG